MGERGRIRELVTEAGFGEPRLVEIPVLFHWPDFDDVWDSLVRLAGPLAQAIAALPPDEHEATRAAIEENTASFRVDDGTYAAPGVTWGVLTR